MLGKPLVVISRWSVKDQEQKVETGQQGGRQIDVLHR